MKLSEILLDQILIVFVAIPLVAYLFSLVWKNHQEKQISLLVQITKIIYLAFALVFAAIWIINGSGTLQFDFLTLYETDAFVFALQFHYDYLSLVFSIVGACLFFMVTTFSKFYLHRDEGFKRFFSTILLFSFGYNLIIFAGNFETLFVGWEIIGLTSFLLIAFYRHRYLPVKNAYKTLSNYRLSDMALILVMWMVHHYMHKNVSFTELTAVAAKIASDENQGTGLFIAGMILFAAVVKSAQFPFTSWLPRSMEGPTSSTAIFYGSLSIHIGVFVLLRTMPIWEPLPVIKWTVLVFGALTAIISTTISRIQTSVKTQIAYSSAAQIGLMFIEVALGWEVLALIHFAGNAFLRTYQLLVSPSVLNYLLHHQIFHYHPPKDKPLGRIQATLYTLGVKEWNMDINMYEYVWSPFKWIGKQFGFMGNKPFYAFLLMSVMLRGTSMLEKRNYITAANSTTLFFGIALALTLAAFSYRGKAQSAWKLLLLAHLGLFFGFLTTAPEKLTDMYLYVGGILAAFLTGHFLLRFTKKKEGELTLNQFSGLGFRHKNTALAFLLSTIGIIGFPITTAFIGIDVLLTYIETNQVMDMVLLILTFIFLELAAIRIYLRVYLGPYQDEHGVIALRSS